MLEKLKLSSRYDGFVYLAEAKRHPPFLRSHHHVELEVNLVVQGEITYVVGERRFRFGRRTLLWLFPGQEHQLVDRTTDSQYYVVVFKPALVSRVCRSALYVGLKRTTFAGGGVLHTLLEPQTLDLVHRTMDSLMVGAPNADTLNREVGFGPGSSFHYKHDDPDGLNAGLRHLMLLCWRCQRSGRALGSDVSLHSSVVKALDLLSTNEGDEDLTQLGKRCGASGPYLSRMFRKQIGIPLSRYRNSVRLAQFWEHYKGPVQLTISEAIYAAGFGSYAQFYKVFKEAYGSGPRACIASNPNDHISGN